jgi:hypothetical protein
VRGKVTDIVKSTGTPFLDLFDSYTAYRPSKLWVNLENTHWNGFATGIAAEKLLDLLSSERMINSTGDPMPAKNTVGHTVPKPGT